MPPAPVRVLTDPDVRCVGLRGDRDERDHRDHRDHGEQRVASSLHDFASDVAAKRRDGRELDKRLPKPLIYATVFPPFPPFFLSALRSRARVTRRERTEMETRDLVRGVSLSLTGRWIFPVLSRSTFALTSRSSPEVRAS